MDKQQLIERISSTALLRGDFTLRSGRKSSYYLDKYLFETQPDILAALGKLFAQHADDLVDRFAGLPNRQQKIQQVGGITSSDGLLGQFTDDHGGEYFMLTNLAQGPEMSAKEGEVTFHVKFADGAAALYRLNRYTGKSEKVMNAGGRELAVTLPGGTGDLFKWGDAAFAGL